MFLSNIAAGDPLIEGNPLPLLSELLAKPVVMKTCPGFVVIEWRGTQNKPETKQTIRGEKVIELTCSLSVKLFDEFILNEGLSKKNNRKPHIGISLLPWDVIGTGNKWGDGDGDDYRNLNDTTFRFKDRTKFTGPNGGEIDLWGVTERKLSHIFIRNDPLTNDNEPHRVFFKVLSHEIFHTLSNHYGIFKSLGRDKQYKDEQLALKFDAFVLKRVNW